MNVEILNRVQRLVHTFSPATFADALGRGPGDRRPLHDQFYGFNRQFLKAAIIVRLLRRLPVDAFVETGTYTGATSLLVLAQTQLPVLTCESNPRFYRRAWWTLAPFGRRAWVCHADSRDFLRRVVTEQRCARPFVYLDAHWGKDVPLRGELEIVLASFADFAIAIDDFKVAADDGFHFDTYGGESLEWSYIEQTVLRTYPEVAVFAPAYPTGQETGGRSGWIMLASTSLAASIVEIVPPTLLQRVR